MSSGSASALVYQVLWATAILVGPPLLVGTVIAFLIGILQSVTQTQEQTLPQTIKMVMITLVLVFLGSSLMAPLYTFTMDIFSNFYRFTR